VTDERETEPTPGAACPRCGERVDPRQLVCLDCGARVALEEHRSWSDAPLGLLAALLLVVIVAGAGLFGFAVSELTSDEGGEPSSQAAGVSPGGGEGPAVVSGSEQEPRRSTETAPKQEPPAERPPANPNAVPGWPAGLRAHTVVLVTTSDGPAARRVAEEARGSGLEAGLIRSEPFNLGSGLWIVYTGRFDTREGALRQAAGLQDRYPGAYPQLLQRSQ
jgi:hypothetical protein